MENLAKRISVAPFTPYTTYTTKRGSMKSGIRPQPLEKSQKINKSTAMFIPDSRVQRGREQTTVGYTVPARSVQLEAVYLEALL